MIQIQRGQYTEQELKFLKEILIDGAESFCCGLYRPQYCNGCSKVHLCNDLIRAIQYLDQAKPIISRRK